MAKKIIPVIALAILAMVAVVAAWAGPSEALPFLARTAASALRIVAWMLTPRFLLLIAVAIGMWAAFENRRKKGDNK